MALKQTEMGKGRETPASGYVHGAIQVAISTYVFTDAFTAASDKLEMGVLPAGARPVSAKLVGEGLGAITADLGFMSGEWGSNDAARTVGDELIDGGSVNDATAAATDVDCLAVTASDKHRGLGVVLSGNVAAGAAKKLTLILEYYH